eukprot:gnl/MRDRNA2_/MRDRNA2_18243_c0_seq1.p1 gnl/MRDRNA2_/MRDRNA2_18243_c0~~gnl/MRDRNA2_/MRDRNA2_18243_c0_seq1.p1  ORF type:complete len:383 (+),score=49.74 gnl/MRDRNA2_/MRDRNA2_18243_c0_seq1:61-1209(+)
MRGLSCSSFYISLTYNAFAVDAAYARASAFRLGQKPHGGPVTVLLSHFDDGESPYVGMKTESLQNSGHVFIGDVVLGGDQKLSMLFDTGSGNLVVPAKTCVSDGCEGHHRFRPEDSSSGHFDIGKGSIELSFSTGKIAGNGFQDSVCIQGACGPAHFVVASVLSDEFKGYHFDGILGLGPPDQALGPGYNVINALVQAGALPKAMFALALQPGHDGSVATLGGYDPSAIKAGSTMQWLPVRWHRSEWAIPVNDVSVAGERIHACVANRCRAVIDSGCAGIVLPQQAARRLHEQFQIPSSSVFDCGNISALPPLSIMIGNSTYTIGPEAYVEVSKVDSSKCRTLIHQVDDFSTRSVVLGHPFFFNHYVVFDQENLQIGIAPST